MRRKARGTIEQVGERWSLRIPVDETDPVTGEVRRIRRRIDLGDTAELRSVVAARRAGDAWIARRQPEDLTTGKGIRFGVYVQREFLPKVVSRYRRKTRRNYAQRLRLDIEPALGSRLMSRIGTVEINQLISDLMARRRARSTILLVRAMVLQVIRAARADGFDAQQIDPKLIRVPIMDKVEREARQVSPTDLDRVLASAAYPWRAAYACMGYLGLRVSEALGLTWRHLDIDSAMPVASIRQAAADGELFPLKTKTSRADLPIRDELVAILREYRAVWQPNALGLLFATRTGRPARAEDVRRRQWNPLLERLGMESAGFHALRHGLTRRLFQEGCSAQVVRQMMRHGSLQMTQRYTHANAEDLRAAITASRKNETLHSRPQLPTSGDSAGKLPGSGECGA